MNALTAVTIKQQIIRYKCGAHDDPVCWRQVMVQLYQNLWDANPLMMLDTKFAKYIVTLMSQSNEWHYCCDSLHDKVCQGEIMGRPLSSAVVLQHLKHEEVEMKIAPSIVSINALVTKRKLLDGGDNVVPSSYTAGSSNQNNCKLDKAHQWQTKHPAPYDNQQWSAPCKICENTYCETLIGHVKANCFSYGGGKAGKYPKNFCGKRDIHLSPEARIATCCKSTLEGRANKHFSGLGNYAEDVDEDVRNVISTVVDDFAFMSMLPDEEGDEITIDEEIKVNAIICNATVDQNDSIHHDTGASHQIFHKHELFHDYAMFWVPIGGTWFGTSLITQAIGKGKIILKSTYDGLTHNFSVSNVLHIPTAPCNLVSRSRLDQKGVNTQTGKGKITYFNTVRNHPKKEPLMHLKVRQRCGGGRGQR